MQCAAWRVDAPDVPEDAENAATLQALRTYSNLGRGGSALQRDLFLLMNCRRRRRHDDGGGG